MFKHALVAFLLIATLLVVPNVSASPPATLDCQISYVATGAYTSGFDVDYGGFAVLPTGQIAIALKENKGALGSDGALNLVNTNCSTQWSAQLTCPTSPASVCSRFGIANDPTGNLGMLSRVSLLNSPFTELSYNWQHINALNGIDLPGTSPVDLSGKLLFRGWGAGYYEGGVIKYSYPTICGTGPRTLSIADAGVLGDSATTPAITGYTQLGGTTTTGYAQAGCTPVSGHIDQYAKVSSLSAPTFGTLVQDDVGSDTNYMAPKRSQVNPALAYALGSSWSGTTSILPLYYVSINNATGLTTSTTSFGSGTSGITNAKTKISSFDVDGADDFLICTRTGEIIAARAGSTNTIDWLISVGTVVSPAVQYCAFDYHGGFWFAIQTADANDKVVLQHYSGGNFITPHAITAPVAGLYNTTTGGGSGGGSGNATDASNALLGFCSSLMGSSDGSLFLCGLILMTTVFLAVVACFAAFTQSAPTMPAFLAGSIFAAGEGVFNIVSGIWNLGVAILFAIVGAAIIATAWRKFLTGSGSGPSE